MMSSYWDTTSISSWWYSSAWSRMSSGMSMTSNLAPSSSSCQTRPFIATRSTTPLKLPSAPIGSWMTATVASRRSLIESTRGEEVGAEAVHLVDEAHAGHVVLVGLTPHGLGLGLDAGHAVEHGHGAVEHAQRPLHLDGEVDVARRVDDVDAVVVPEGGGGGGGDGDAALLLLHHPVHRPPRPRAPRRSCRSCRCSRGSARSWWSCPRRCGP